MGLRPGQLAVLVGYGLDPLVGYGLDPLVEAVWTRKASLLAELARQRWDLVLAPNYSMYGKAALLHQMQGTFEIGNAQLRGLRRPH
jgi:hypothetical protein